MNIQEHQAEQRSFVNQAYQSKDNQEGALPPTMAVQAVHTNIVMARRAEIAAQIAKTYAPAVEPTQDTELG